jgi:glycosyltransferase involved in cell wall biosynthesis
VDIAIVTTRLVDNDAQGNFTAATMSALKKICDKVSLFTFSYERPPIEGVDVHFMAGRNTHSLGSNMKVALNTGRLAKELARYDMLLLVGPDLGALPAAHRAKRYNSALKLIWVYHGLTPPEFLSGLREKALSRARKAGYVRSMRQSDLVQADSSFVVDELKRAGVDASKLVAMPVGVELKRFATGDRAKVRAKYHIGDTFLLLYVGRLAGLKHVDDLIRAMASMKDDDVRLMVVGGGPELERLETQVKNSSVGDRVIFTGRVADNELPDYYAACDAWVTASRHEGFCVPIVEAMAAGKPVIVPDVAAMPETAGDGGLVYSHDDSKDLVEDARLLMKDRTLYERLSNNAARRAISFEMQSVMGRYIDMLMSVNGRKGA